MLLIGLSCLMALKCLGWAYARKQLTELMVLFTAVWAISLLFQALSAASEMGRRGVVMLQRARCGRPPTLLVLRVFQHEAQVQSLFDHVVERWRLSVNTLLIAGTDLPARTLDADGRFRVNECYCHDSTWQLAPEALVQRSDVVLMDLRSFQARNAGCLFELAALAGAQGPRRVVVLNDGQSDRAAAGAPPGRCRWLDTSHIDARKRREVLHALFVPAPMN